LVDASGLAGLNREALGNFGPLGARQDAVGVTDPRFQLGLPWRPIDDFNVDLIYGRNVYGENANWITLATVVRFQWENNGSHRVPIGGVTALAQGNSRCVAIY
jgi:hypothetical protein